MSKRALFLAVVLLLVMSSCKPVSDIVSGFSVGRRTVPFDKVAIDSSYAEMEDRLTGLRNVALDIGWQEPVLPKGFLEGSDEALGYMVVRAQEGKPSETFTVWSADERDSLLAGSAEKGHQTAVSPVYHCRPWINRASPLPLAARQWSDAQLGEWLAWEWAAARIGTDTDEELSAVSYVAWRSAEELITRMKGPGSLELARWRESVRDRRTFQLLAVDLRDQVAGVIAAHPEAADREETLRRIERSWLNVFHENYSGRFITNIYLDFGADRWVPPLEIEAIGRDALGWNRYDALVPQSMTSTMQILETVEKSLPRR